MADGACTMRSNSGSIVFHHVVNEMMVQLNHLKRYTTLIWEDKKVFGLSNDFWQHCVAFNYTKSAIEFSTFIVTCSSKIFLIANICEKLFYSVMLPNDVQR